MCIPTAFTAVACESEYLLRFTEHLHSEAIGRGDETDHSSSMILYNIRVSGRPRGKFYGKTKIGEYKKKNLHIKKHVKTSISDHNHTHTTPRRSVPTYPPF